MKDNLRIMWCDKDYSVTCKDIEMAVADIPVLSLVVHIKPVKALEDLIDPIPSHTLDITFDLFKQYKLETEVTLLSWFA